MPHTNEDHQEYVEELNEEAKLRAEAIQNAQTVDELFERTIRDPGDLSQREREAHQYYKEKIAKFEESFDDYRKQFTWGSDLAKPKTKEEQAERAKTQSEHKKALFGDELNKYTKDEKFIKGAAVAKFMEPDKEILARAADIIKEKQGEYDKLNPFAKFMSILPFNNKYKKMLTDIEEMKDKVVSVTKCDKADLEDYVNGKTDKMPESGKDAYSYQTLNGFLKNADAEAIETIEVELTQAQKDERKFQNFYEKVKETPFNEKLFDDINALSEEDEEPAYEEPTENAAQETKQIEDNQKGMFA